MIWQHAHHHRVFEITYLATILALSLNTSLGDDRPKPAPGDGGVAVERLLEQLRSDPERSSGEAFSDWLRRISLKNLDVADKIIAHPDATAEHKAEAIDRMLTALDQLARSDPDRYKKRWRTFANRIVDEYPGSPMARNAASGLLNHQISDDPADPGIISDIERFARTYPDSGGHTCQLYLRLTGLVYKDDPDRALGILDRAILSVPPDLAASLRQHKNRLTMIGSRLTMSWPKLNGSRLSMDDLRGKVVLMYSWATWCGPCIAKFPILNELHAKYHKRGFEIVAVSQDDDPLDVIKFLKGKDLPWNHTMHSEEYREQYGFMGTPGSILIDRDGIVADRAIFSREEIESVVKQLLDEPAAIKSGLPTGAPVPGGEKGVRRRERVQEPK